MKKIDALRKHYRPRRKAGKITQRRKLILDFIGSYQGTHQRPPTMREIADASGLKAVSAVYAQLGYLEDMGLIERDPRVSRGIRLVEENDHA
jgi:repressor LexA